MPGYTTQACRNDVRSASVNVLVRDIYSWFKSGVYAEVDSSILLYGAYAPKLRWVHRGPSGYLVHVRIAYVAQGVHTHYASGTIPALLAAYPELTPPGLLAMQPKIVGTKNIAGAERFEFTGIRVDGSEEVFDVTIPAGTTEDDIVFIGGLKLRADAKPLPLEDLRWFTDLYAVKPKPPPPSDATGTADGGGTTWLTDADRGEAAGTWLGYWLRVTGGTNFGTDAVQITSSAPGVVNWAAGDAFPQACDATTRYVLAEYASTFLVVWDYPALVNWRAGVAVEHQAASIEQIQLGRGPRSPALSQAFPSNLYLVYEHNGDIRRMIKRNLTQSGADRSSDGWSDPVDLTDDGTDVNPELHHMDDGRSFLLLERGGVFSRIISRQEGAGGDEDVEGLQS